MTVAIDHVKVDSVIETSKAINTNWLASDITPYGRTVAISASGQNQPVVAHSFQISMAAGGIVNVQYKNGGSTEVVNLNEGIALNAGALYRFTMMLELGDTYNIQHSTGGTQDISIRIVETLDLGI